MTDTELRANQSDNTAAAGCGGTCAVPAKFSVSRRTALGAGVVAGAAFVTACGSSSTSTTTGTSTTAGVGTALAKTADIPAGGSLVVVLDKVPYGLAKKADGTVVLHTGVCTHMKCAVQAAGEKFHCNCHQSEYDAFTGAVLQGPATEPLVELAFEEQDGSVVLK